MTTLQPRPPYSDSEIKKLYPPGLQLELVQVLLRHGERSPVSARFQNAGLVAFWPYCSVARQMVSATREANQNKWTPLQWRRRLETFGSDDGPVIASGPKGEVDSICNLGELTDKGRETTYSLGRRLRHLYVDQLHFMPPVINDADMIYLRATPIPRALESLQQAFWGMYPSNARAASFPAVSIILRAPADETLFPNDSNCRRFAQLSRAFAQRTADRWNNTSEMEYLNKLIGKWMPESSKRVAVDSHPRLSGIMDTINSTLAHGPETRLPKEFYDEKGRNIIEKIGVEEWYSGYQESQEYRSLGIGSLMGDVVERMVGNVEKNGNDGLYEIGGRDGSTGSGRGGEQSIKLGLSGCHDTTLAGVLASLGTFQGELWPPYTSHIAFELFKKSTNQPSQVFDKSPIEEAAQAVAGKGWYERLFRGSSPTASNGDKNAPVGIARQKLENLKESDRAKLEGYYVRIRYNDKVMSVPGCKAAGKHLDGDESFCTLEAFKGIVDKYTPSHWKQACLSNMEVPAFPENPEPAGY
ncbi:histidine acid phosphatase-like protein [Hyaloscypha variabilis F]|uniref:3-phytase n=1 Tax=Hyaloscypha variabilis (strain UAMH 11265 / GT02V1 / F) TaxID=1149755 RepID=A0A2J6RDP4_HYAVF|nr:histidine acid phosphatase-like protein [Hyaloscypha variabilis F]